MSAAAVAALVAGVVGVLVLRGSDAGDGGEIFLDHPTPRTTADDPLERLGGIAALVAGVRPSVVGIRSQGGGTRSGVVFSERGVVLSVGLPARARAQAVLASGEVLPAVVLAADDASRVSVLRVDRGELPAARFADDVPLLGEVVVAAGAALGLRPGVAAGVVSGVAPRSAGGVDVLFLDRAAPATALGGPVVDSAGTVVGLAAARAAGVTTVVLAPTAVAVARAVLARRPVVHAYLGLRGRPLTAEIADRFGLLGDGSGVVVDEVDRGSPAAAAGVRPGDVLVAVGGAAVASPGDLVRAVAERAPRDRVALVLVRGARHETVTAVLAQARPGG